MSYTDEKAAILKLSGQDDRPETFDPINAYRGYVRGNAIKILDEHFPIWKDKIPNGTRMRIAGNCLNDPDNARDIDLFPTAEDQEPRESGDLTYPWFSHSTIVDQTNDVITFTFKDTVPIQWCRYWYPTLKELVDTFDFSHIQLGVEVTKMATGWKKDQGNWRVDEVYFSNHHLFTKLTGLVSFHNRSPTHRYLSSLTRLFRYIERGMIPASQGGSLAVRIAQQHTVWRINELLEDEDE